MVERIAQYALFGLAEATGPVDAVATFAWAIDQAIWIQW
jgi:hypothetical protein